MIISQGKPYNIVACLRLFFIFKLRNNIRLPNIEDVSPDILRIDERWHGNICYFAGCEVRMVKNCDRGLEVSLVAYYISWSGNERMW